MSNRRNDRQSAGSLPRRADCSSFQRGWDAPVSRGRGDYERSRDDCDRDGKTGEDHSEGRDKVGGRASYNRDCREPSSRRSLSSAARGEAAASRKTSDDRDRASSGREAGDAQSTSAKGQQTGSREPRPPPPLPRSPANWATAYDHLRALWTSGAQASRDFSPRDVPVFIAIDTETWELMTGRDKTCAQLTDSTLEVGWSIVEPVPLGATPAPPRPWNSLDGRLAPLEGASSLPPIGSWQQTTTHYVVEANYKLHRQNGRYVPDHRDGFLFGEISGMTGPFSNGTRFASFQEIGQELRKTILALHDERQNVYVVFHDAKGDLPTLHALGIDTSTWQRQALSVIQPSNAPSIYVVDTIELFSALRGVSQMTNLKTCSLVLNVNGGVVENTHNAGNDAFFTAAILASMLAGPPLLEMRKFVEARWQVALAVSKGSSFKKRYKKR